PKVMMAVMLEAARYRLTSYMVDEHRRLAIEVVWPKLESSGIKIGEARLEAEVQEIIGAGALKELRVTTDAIMTNFDENVQSLQAAFTALRTELIKIFPKVRFVNFQFSLQLEPGRKLLRGQPAPELTRR